MKVVLLYSGGLDSTVLLYSLLNDGHEPHCVTMDYQQRHAREIGAAAAITAELGIGHEIISIDPSIFGSTVLTNHGSANLIVPNRNAVLLSTAGAIALRDDRDAVAIACHGGDHDIWPDCRPPFMDAVQQMLFACDDRRIHLLRPFIRSTKLDIVKMGMKLGVPFDKSWTCYAGKDEPCGICVACIGRREALFLAGA